MNFIEDFQKKHNLTVDGKIGKNTLKKIKEVFNIPSDTALAHFMGNIHHETGGFKAFSENLNYSDKGLVSVFKKYFPTIESTKGYARNPEKIANKVYANRMGNGDEKSGDGWKFRGRGALQTTGKQNYTLFTKETGVDFISNPDLIAEDPDYAIQSAIFYFEKNKLWTKCKDISDDNIKLIRKAVNGGNIGLSEVTQKVYYFYNLIKNNELHKNI